MSIDEIFLKKSKLDKLEVVQLILADQYIYTNELMQHADISRSRLKRLIHDINDDLKTIFTEEEMIAQNNQFQYYIRSDFSRNQIFHRLKLFYLEQSIHFELTFLLILGTNQKTIDELCDHFFISTSYLYQLIRETNELLEDFDIQIARKNKDCFIMEGRESRIRLFTFVGYLFSYHGLKPPLKTQEKKLPVFIASLPLTKSEKDLIQFVYTISELRMTQGCFIEEIPEEIEEIFDTFYLPEEVQKFNQEYIHSFTEDPQIQNREQLFCRLLIRTFVYELDTLQQRIESGKKLKTLDNALTNFCQSLIDRLLKEYEIELSDRLNEELLYYASLIVSFIEYFQIDLDADLSLNFAAVEKVNHQTNEKRSIKEFYTEFLDEYQGDLTCVKNRRLFFEFVSKRLNLLKYLNTTGQLTIYIHYSRNVLGEVTIRKKLHQMFNQDVLKITKEISRADIVISDCIEDEEEAKEYFFFYDISNEKVWRNLFTFLQKRIGDQIILNNEK